LDTNTWDERFDIFISEAAIKEYNMFQDPIVEEIRKTGEKLALSVGYDKLLFIERLRENQRKSNRQVVSFTKRNKTTA
jgi:hypothetical protein